MGGIVLLDGGFLSSTPKRWLPEFEKLGFAPEQVEAILVSHGHIDHTLNLAEWKRLTGARIYAPALDQAHLEGTFPYTGVAKVCGILEAAARTLFRYEIPEVDVWIESGETLPFWGGLEVVGLPGHTLGHVGYYSASRKLLFANDLFSSFRGKVKLPTPWFNDHGEEIPQSILKAAAFDLSRGVLINHGHPASTEDYRSELLDLADRVTSGLI